MTSASSTTKPWVSEASRQGRTPTAQSTSATVPHERQTTWGLVVADAQLVAGDRAGRLDPADEAGVAQHAEHVVDGLVRDGRLLGADGREDAAGVGVRVTAHGTQDGQARPGDPEVRGPQQLFEVSLGVVVVHRPPPCRLYLNESSLSAGLSG